MIFGNLTLCSEPGMDGCPGTMAGMGEKLAGLSRTPLQAENIILRVSP